MTRDTIIQAAATLFCLCAALFLAIMSWLLYRNQERRIEAVILEPVSPLTHEQEDDLIAVLDALDRVIKTLEAYEMEEYTSVVADAEQVLEQYQARLESEREG